jgi:hypothetical protein
VLLVLLLLLVGGGAGAWYFFAGPGAVAQNPTPTPEPSTAPSVAPSASVAAESALPSASPDPTPAPGDEFLGYEVTVTPGTNDIFRIDDAGAVVQESIVFFDAVSQAPVDRVVAANGLLHWRVLEGETIDWSYIRDRSGPFRIREVYRGPDGSLRYAVLPESET